MAPAFPRYTPRRVDAPAPLSLRIIPNTIRADARVASGGSVSDARFTLSLRAASKLDANARTAGPE